MFQDAQKSQTYMRLGLTGPSGSGKTMSALLIAYGLAGDWSKIGLVCTEGGSGALYANYNRGGVQIGIYKFLKLEPPYEPQKYISAVQAAVRAGLKVVILDTISHAWAGTGGLLDKHGRLADSGKFNSFTAWRMVTPEHNALVDAMLQSPIHVIATLRVKTEWVIEENERGRTMPRKIGLAPIQRDGMEYEFTIVFDLAQDHSVVVSKDRTGLFDGRIFVPGIETGREMLAWLNEKPEPGPAQNFVPASAPEQKSVLDPEPIPAPVQKPKSEPAPEPEPEPEPVPEPEPEPEADFFPENEAASEPEPAQDYPAEKVVLGRAENMIEWETHVFRTAKFSNGDIGYIFALKRQGEVYDALKSLKAGKKYEVTVWDDIPEDNRSGLPEALQAKRLVMIGKIVPVEKEAVA